MKIFSFKHHLELTAIKHGLGIVLKMSKKARSRLGLFTVINVFDAPHYLNPARVPNAVEFSIPCIHPVIAGPIIYYDDQQPAYREP
jgi:hypothetical protein